MLIQYMAQVKRRKVMPRTSLQLPLKPNSHFTLSCPFESAPETKYQFHLLSRDYETMKQSFHETCVDQTSCDSKFTSTDFPSKSVTESLICCYIDSFQPIFPFLHLPTLPSSNLHWLLLLAMAAIGSHFLEVGRLEVFTESFHEVIRRVTSFSVVTTQPFVIVLLTPV